MAVTIKSKSLAQSESRLMMMEILLPVQATVTTFTSGESNPLTANQAVVALQLAVTLTHLTHHLVILITTAETVRSLKLVNFSAIL